MSRVFCKIIWFFIVFYSKGWKMGMVFWRKLEELCLKNGIAPTNLPKVVPNLNVTGGSISGWKNGAVPRPDKIKALADYFHVPVETLTEDGAIEVTNLTPLTAVDPFETQLIEIYNELPAQNKVELLSYAYRLLDGNKTQG